MKTFVLCVVLVLFMGWMMAMSRAADDPDRIFITRLQPFLLKPSTNRPDHKEFFIQIFTQNRRFELTKTNLLLTIYDLDHVPDGPAVLVVNSVCSDGEKSPEVPFDIDIRKSPPAAPNVQPVPVTEEEATAKTLEQLRFIRRRADARENPPPAPPGAVIPIPEMPTPPPLPNATNRPYVSTMRRNE